MLSVKDFKAGQTAYVLRRKRGKTVDHEIKRQVVLSVGRKYVKVADDPDSRFPDEYFNLRGTDDYLSEKDYCNNRSRLFPTYEAAVEDIEKEMLTDKILKELTRYRLESLKITRLRAIKALMEEENGEEEK